MKRFFVAAALAATMFFAACPGSAWEPRKYTEQETQRLALICLKAFQVPDPDASGGYKFDFALFPEIAKSETCTEYYDVLGYLQSSTAEIQIMKTKLAVAEIYGFILKWQPKMVSNEEILRRIYGD